MSDRALRRGIARELVAVVRRAERRGRSGAGAGADGPDLLPSGSTFIRGLSIGALVGAAIAGSTIWERRHRRRTDRDATTVAVRDAGDPAGS